MIRTGQAWRLDGECITLVFVAAGQENIDLAYLGSQLPEDEDLDALVRSRQYGKHENQPDEPPVGGFLPNINAGYRGTPTLQLQRGDKNLETWFNIDDVDISRDEINFTWLDQKNDLALHLCWEIRTGDMVCSRYSIENNAEETAYLTQMASVMLPLPPQYDRFTHFTGRWAGEMVAHSRCIGHDTIELCSRGGKSGFSGGDWLLLEDATSGAAIGYHYAWSGDHRIRIEQNDSGHTMLIGGSAPEQSPIPLRKHEVYQTPAAMFTPAIDRDAVTNRFHHHIRSRHVLHRRDQTGPRKVHLNSWEALGFNLDEQKLLSLANHAANIGVERFVLDDGWFKGRRSANAGLGDWTVDTGLFPNGLKPLIDHVHSLDMDFGLWVEPEMISPDSDLYRAHPDWVIKDNSGTQPTERNQLVLDLCHPGVLDHLFACLDRLLTENDIAYLKWDHNRRAFPAANQRDIPEYLQVLALYELLERLHKAYPDLEIESCSSGGGRADLALLSRCNRIWPSDNNDPVERLRIMDSWSKFLPLETLGNHVGPSPNPVTGRSTNMDFRAKVAMFGHMGVETNPADMSAQERRILCGHIELYKKWRDVLHNGALWQLAHPEETIFGQIVVHDNIAIAFVAQTAFAENFNVAPVRLKGLEPQASYKITLPKPWPVKASQYLADPNLWSGNLVLSGQILMDQGLALPLTHPETAWIITIEKVST